MKIKKIIYIAVGCIGLGLGALGAAIPLLPSFPFLLLAAVCFTKSSEKLDVWFKGTKLYKHNLESYIKGEGMSWPAKLRMMITLTIVMGIAFIAMHALVVGRIVLSFVWLFHVLYFCFGVKTLKKANAEK